MICKTLTFCPLRRQLGVGSYRSPTFQQHLQQIHQVKSKPSTSDLFHDCPLKLCLESAALTMWKFPTFSHWKLKNCACVKMFDHPEAQTPSIYEQQHRQPASPVKTDTCRQSLHVQVLEFLFWGVKGLKWSNYQNMLLLLKQ